MDKIRELLQSFSIFKKLNKEEMIPVLEITQMKSFAAGSHIFMQGEPLKSVFFIIKGKIKIYKTDINGKEQIVSILSEQEMFPHVGFFREGDYPAHAQVLEDTDVAVIPIKRFEDIVLKNPDICIKMFKVLGERIVDLQIRLEEQILNNTFEQIIRLMIRLADSHGKKIGNDQVVIHTHFTNKDLASMIGTSRETVSRTLNQLKKKKIIDVNKDGYYVIYLKKMEEELAR